MTGLWPEGCGGGFAADFKKASPRPPSFRPQRSGVEKSSSSDGTGSITVGDLSTQSIMGAFSICPIPTCSPARDDGGDGHHWTHLRCEGPKGSEGKVLKIDRPLAGGFLSLTGLWPEGCGLPLRAMSIIMPPFGGHVHIKYHNHSYPRTSLRHFVALFL